MALFVEFYKKVCSEIVKLCEKVCCTNILALQTNILLELTMAKRRLEKSAETARLEILEIYQTIVNYSLILFERFSQKTTKVTRPWLEFVQRIDSVFQESILVCVQSSMDKFLILLTGSVSFRADPVIDFGVKMEEHQIVFDPPLDHLELFLKSLMMHLAEVFIVTFSIWRKFDTEKHPLTPEEIKGHVVNQKILEGIRI